MDEVVFKYFERKKFIIVISLIIFMWISLIVFFYMKADEVTLDPCSICAKRMGNKVICTTQSSVPLYRTYYPNGSIATDYPYIIDERITFNFSGG